MRNLEFHQRTMRERLSRPVTKKPPIDKGQLRSVLCVCGAVFLTLHPLIRRCALCRKRGRGRHVGQLARMHNAKTIGHHSEEEWRERLRGQNWQCHYCFIDMTELTWTRDHVVPLCVGGTDYILNIVAACRTCNCRKGKMSATAFRRYLETVERQQKKQFTNISVDKTLKLLQAKAKGETISTLFDVEPEWIDAEYRRQNDLPPKYPQESTEHFHRS